MAESNGQEKTEKPTGKRRSDARKEGNVLQSRDVANVILLFSSFTLLHFFIPSIYKTVKEYMVFILSDIDAPFESVFSYETYARLGYSVVRCALPLLFAVTAVAILAHWGQTRFLVTFRRLKPDLSKLNPISGIKHLFSLKNLVGLLGNLFKCSLLIILLYFLMKGELVPAARMMDMSPINAGAYSLQMVYDLVKKVCLAFAVIAFFDFLYRRWDYEKNLMMTKQEVKDEFKQTEGNPEIKGRIRKIQRQMALSRMMQKVPEADVIIRNPTHLAIALRYNPHKDRAPVVLAKGQDELALRIVRVGKENGVSVIENRELARALYPVCDLDREIPPEFYGAVAEILVYIYRAAGKEDLLR